MNIKFTEDMCDRLLQRNDSNGRSAGGNSGGSNGSSSNNGLKGELVGAAEYFITY